jgi:BRCT domain type II-containing protein
MMSKAKNIPSLTKTGKTSKRKGLIRPSDGISQALKSLAMLDIVGAFLTPSETCEGTFLCTESI